MGLTQASSDASALCARQSSDSGNNKRQFAFRSWLQAVESTEIGLFRPRRADCRSWCCVRPASPRTAPGLGPDASVAARIASCRQAVHGDGPQDCRQLRIKRRGRDRTAFSDRTDAGNSKREHSSVRLETPDALGPAKGATIGFGVGAALTLAGKDFAQPIAMFVIGGVGAAIGLAVGGLVRVVDGPVRIYEASKPAPPGPRRSGGDLRQSPRAPPSPH